MKKALLIHNPTAGDGNHNKAQLLEKISLLGFEAQYISTDTEGWEERLKETTDAVFLAGGDGTFHKGVAVFLKHKETAAHLIPLYLFALGTANNIVKSLLNTTSIIKGQLPSTGFGTGFDLGRVKGIPEKEFFVESMGAGVFPELIHVMKNRDLAGLNPEEKLQQSLRELLKVVETFSSVKLHLKADGIRIKGRFLLVELMNIRYVGPNLDVAPRADPGDGFFDLALIPDSERAAFIAYLKKRIEGEDSEEAGCSFVKTFCVRKMTLKAPKSKLHVDDSLITEGIQKRMCLTLAHEALYVIA